LITFPENNAAGSRPAAFVFCAKPVLVESPMQKPAYQPSLPSGLTIANSNSEGAPHPTARKVIEMLSAQPAPLGSAPALRAHYTKSRRQFLAPLDPIHSRFHIHGAPGVPHLTIIRPQRYAHEKSLPALVFLHGGGWTLGSLETYEPFCRQLANATGSIIVWVEYRLAPEHPFPAAYNDARAALRWVYDNALRLGVDENRIMLGGDSAGGNIAAAVCLAERNERTPYQPWRQILLYPCLDISASMPSHRKFAESFLLTKGLYAWYRENYAGQPEKPNHWRLSPLFAHDVSGLPPTVLLYAGFDPLRDEAAAYAVKLTLADVKLETLYFADMIHGFLTMGGVIPAAQAAVNRIADALAALSD
jgi:acetyl esterase